LRKHDHIIQSKLDMIEKTKQRCKSCKYTDFTESYPYSLAGWEGIPKYLYDYSTIGTGGLTGNLVATYLGSYSLEITATRISCKKGLAQLTFVVNNTSSLASATRPPVLGYTVWWQTYVAPYLNQWLQEGGMSPTTQTFRWSENVEFDANPCCKK